MTRNNKMNWIVVALAITAFTAVSSTDAAAWGPYAQAVIAEHASGFSGTPHEVHTDIFNDLACVPKAWEYTESSYAKVSADFSGTMLHASLVFDDLTQALAWGSAQTAEATGDTLYFKRADFGSQDGSEFGQWEAEAPVIRRHPRWLLELFVDAGLLVNNFGTYDNPTDNENDPLTNIESYRNTAQTAGIACRPKLVFKTSKAFTDIYGGRVITYSEALRRTSRMARAMLGEKVLCSNLTFQQNALEIAPIEEWLLPMDQTVNSVINYLHTTTIPLTEPIEDPVLRSAPFTHQLLSMIGDMVLASGHAVIGMSFNSGIYSYNLNIVNPEGADAAMMRFLNDVLVDLGVDPEVREQARTLLTFLPGPRPEYIGFRFRTFESPLSGYEYECPYSWEKGAY